MIDQETVLAVAFYDGNECEGGIAYKKSSFLIIEIADRYIKGKFAIGQITEPDS